jgi:hypothetical protein
MQHKENINFSVKTFMSLLSIISAGFLSALVLVRYNASVYATICWAGCKQLHPALLLCASGSLQIYCPSLFFSFFCRKIIFSNKFRLLPN